MKESMRRVRDVVSIKRTIWSNYDKFRTLGVFYLEKNAVLEKVLGESDENIARIANECREGGVRWRGFQKYLNKIEKALIGEREIIDLSKTEEKAIEAVADMSVAELVNIIEAPDGVKVSFNISGTFDVLCKGNRNGCFEVHGMGVTPNTEFTLVNELNAFWEDRYSVALKSEGFSVALSAEDPGTGKKGSACVRIYIIEGDRIIIDDLGKYIDTSSMTLWVNP